MPDTDAELRMLPTASVLLDPDVFKALQDRLARIEGHVRGVRRMLEAGSPCDDILLQLAAVKAAVMKVEGMLLEDHIDSCVVPAVRSGEGDEAVRALKRALRKLL